MFREDRFKEYKSTDAKDTTSGAASETIHNVSCHVSSTITQTLSKFTKTVQLVKEMSNVP